MGERKDTAPAAGDEVALLPCPFCGSTAISFHNTGVGWCCCDDCRAEGPVRGDEADAITAWNTRPTPPPSSDGDAVRVAAVAAIEAFDGLVSESRGVAGLHLNGDVAEWDSLSEVGNFPWLAALDQLRSVLDATAPATQPEGEDRSGCRAPQGEPCTCATPHAAPGDTP